MPTSTAALYLVTECELVVAVPEHMCRPTLGKLGLRTRPLPFDLPPVPIVLAWHQRYDNDRPHMWLRARIREAPAFTSRRRSGLETRLSGAPERGGERLDFGGGPFQVVGEWQRVRLPVLRHAADDGGLAAGPAGDGVGEGGAVAAVAVSVE